MIYKVKYIFPILFIFLFISCKSMGEVEMIHSIRLKEQVDLSIFCKDFDELMIFDEGYYWEGDKNNYPGTKIYYLKNGKTVKIFNLHYCSDEPFGDVIWFDFSKHKQNEGVIHRLNTDNMIFYVSSISIYNSGRIFYLSDIKSDIKINDLRKKK